MTDVVELFDWLKRVIRVILRQNDPKTGGNGGNRRQLETTGDNRRQPEPRDAGNGNLGFSQ